MEKLIKCIVIALCNEKKRRNNYFIKNILRARAHTYTEEEKERERKKKKGKEEEKGREGDRELCVICDVSRIK